MLYIYHSLLKVGQAFGYPTSSQKNLTMRIHAAVVTDGRTDLERTLVCEEWKILGKTSVNEILPHLKMCSVVFLCR